MRKLYAKKNQLSTRGITLIKDEHNNAIYTLMGNWGMHRGVLSVYYINGDLSAEIKQKSLGLFPKFELYSHRKKVGSLRRYYGVSRDMLFVKGLNWFIIGNLLTFNYKVFYGRECIMTISKVELTNGAYLEFHIKYEDDEALCLCVAAILDYWARSGKKSAVRNDFWSLSPGL